ncbi:MAG: anhydro-N-acetylmuramic acid kinase [Vicingaceae bacterium]
MNKQKNTYSVLGLMSGTSLDGLDLCACRFTYDEQWKFEIVETDTLPYSKSWQNQLLEAENCSGRKLTQIHSEYGSYLGKQSADFIQKYNLNIDLIASHGHTIFHQPEDSYTLQIGHGGYLCSETNLPTVTDFRSQDIALGGQGAPLVPFGEHHLFKAYKAFLNLGGIANISIHKRGSVIAFDIAAANMVMNYICQKHFNCKYDRNGSIAKSGKFNETLFRALNQYSYYQKAAPKSLGKEDVFETIIPIIDECKVEPKDQLHTYCKHLCYQIMLTVEKYDLNDEKILLSGGGAYNQFLYELLNQDQNFVLPEPKIIEYKEALIFAFLGLMRFLDNPNVFNSVTGARKQSIAGAIYYP